MANNTRKTAGEAGGAGRRAVATDRAPKAIGPYSQAIDAGGMVFCSGQIPLDERGEMTGADISAQTAQVLENLLAVLEAAGLGFDDVAKTTVYLQSMGDFPAMNEVYARYFTDPAPARATVEVAALPKGALVEIDAIAWNRR